MHCQKHIIFLEANKKVQKRYVSPVMRNVTAFLCIILITTGLFFLVLSRYRTEIYNIEMII